MPRCDQVLKALPLRKCTRMALEGGHLCTLHQNIANGKEELAGPVVEGCCPAIKTADRTKRCNKPAHPDGNGFCKLHRTVQNRRDAAQAELLAAIEEEERIRDLHAAEVLARYTAMVEGHDPWMTIVRRLEVDLHDRVIDLLQYRRVQQHLAELRVPEGGRRAVRQALWTLHEWADIEWYRLYGYPRDYFLLYGGPPPPIAPHPVGAGAGPAPIAHIALDKQSIHRAEVSEQTNRGVAILLAVPVPAGQDTINQLYKNWVPALRQMTAAEITKLAKTGADVRQWYKQSYCRKPGDYLYTRLIDHAVALADTSPHKDELYKRLYEEATEAVGMCCDGHINRIVNAFVGIVDGFDCPVAPKELLQTRLAAIAATEKSTEEKQKDARAVLAELSVPEAEHAAWLEAF